MREIETDLKADTLTVKMKLTQGERSKSGKSTILFTTGGFAKIEGTECYISINVIKPKKK